MKAVQARCPRKHDQSGRGAELVQCRVSRERPSPPKTAAFDGRFSLALQPWLSTGWGAALCCFVGGAYGPLQSATIFGPANRWTFKAEIGRHRVAATESWKLPFDGLLAAGRQMSAERLLV